jgi:hypothetical protein
VRLRPIQGLRDRAVSAAKLTRPASQRSLALFSNFDFAHPQQPFAPAACIGGAAVAHEQSTKQSPGGVSAPPCSSRTCTCRTTCTRLWASSQSSRARTRGRSAWRTAEPLRSLHRLRGRRRESLAPTARITTRRNAITMTRMLLGRDGVALRLERLRERTRRQPSRMGECTTGGGRKGRGARPEKRLEHITPKSGLIQGPAAMRLLRAE